MPVLSVIVPTHNRQRYAVNAVRTLLAALPDAEVVVSDTSDDDSLLHDVGIAPAPDRFVYTRPAGVRNIVNNYEHGRRSATGDYLLFLGDDDAVGPDVCRLAAWAQREQVEALACSLPASYGWPDFRSAIFGTGYAATLSVRDYTGAPSDLDTLATLREAAANLGAGPLRMPRAYLGMISRALADRIVSRYGSLFGGVSPDIYSASLISVESRRTVLLDYPFVLPGSSGASGSGAGAARRHIGGLWETSHIASFPGLDWHPLVPEFYSVGTVWAFTLVRAIERIGRDDLTPDFARLYIKSLLLHPEYWREILSALSTWRAQVGLPRSASALFGATIAEALAQSKRVARRIRHPRATADALAIRDIPTVGAAYDRLCALASERPATQPSVLRSA